MQVGNALGRRELLDDLVKNRFVALLASLGVLAHGYVVWAVVAGHSRPPMTRDSALFQHGGWYIADGAAPYLDVWDPKPPLAFEIPAAVGLMTDDPYLLHLLHVALMVGAAVGSIVLAGLLTRYLTDDPTAGLVGGVSMLVLPGYVVRPALGHKPKYLVLVAGLAALYLFVRGNFVLSGVAAGATAGIWQIGLIYPLVVMGLALHRRQYRTLGEVVAGIALVAVVMLVPVVLWGAVEAMLVQAVVVPFVNAGGFPIPVRLFFGVYHFKFGAVLVVLGVYGIVRFARLETSVVRREWWVLACAAWFGIVALFIDFNVWSYTDLIPGLPFVAIGLGLLYATLGPRPRQTLVGLVAAVVVLNVVLLGSFGVLFDPVSVPDPGEEVTETMDKSADYPPAPESVPEPRWLYWNQQPPENCHLRYSVHELQWIQKTGTYPSCGGNLNEALRLLREG